MMRIGIDGRAMEHNRTGTGRYIYEMCVRLGRLMPCAEFYVYSRTPIERPVTASNWHYVVEPNKFLAKMKSVLWLKLRGRYLAQKDHLDVYWAATTFYPRLAKTKIVATIHDVTYKIAPASMKLAMLASNYLFFRGDIKRADRLVAISQGTADKVSRIFNRQVDGIAPPSADKFFQRIEQVQARRILARFEISSDYILGVATLEPRKNLPLLIEAFKASGLAEKGVQLLLAGNVGWKSASLQKTIEDSLGCGVKLLGYVSDEELVALYSTCRAFGFPSVYEGFGMPVREAVCCGATVVATDIPEIREAGRDYATYIPPTLDEWVRALRSQSGQRRCSEGMEFPTWDESAATLVEMLTC